MKALIVEDENLSAQHLQSILERIAHIQVIGRIDSIDDTVAWFSHREPPDILFLDIHLADGSAFEIFNQIDVKCPIVFTTAYDEYALSAFKVNSISYLLKPIKEEDVVQAMAKLQQLQSDRSIVDMRELFHLIKRQSTTFKTHFLVSQKGDKLVPLKVDDIAYVQIEDGIVKAHTFSDQIFYMDQILDELSHQLDPKEFYRANRQSIISRKAVKDLDHWFQGRLMVNLSVSVSEKILISRAKVPEFKSWFTGGD